MVALYATSAFPIEEAVTCRVVEGVNLLGIEVVKVPWLTEDIVASKEMMLVDWEEIGNDVIKVLR